MNKTISNQLKKVIIAAAIFLAAATALIGLTSCKNASGESSIGGNDTVASTSASDTTSQTASPQDQQIIEVMAKTGGYSPGKIEAKSEVPTVLIMKSDGAYGCERSFNVYDPSTKKVLLSEILPENGQTKFDLGTQSKGTQLYGVCSM